MCPPTDTQETVLMGGLKLAKELAQIRIAHEAVMVEDARESLRANRANTYNLPATPDEPVAKIPPADEMHVGDVNHHHHYDTTKEIVEAKENEFEEKRREAEEKHANELSKKEQEIETAKDEFEAEKKKHAEEFEAIREEIKADREKRDREIEELKKNEIVNRSESTIQKVEAGPQSTSTPMHKQKPPKLKAKKVPRGPLSLIGLGPKS